MNFALARKIGNPPHPLAEEPPPALEKGMGGFETYFLNKGTQGIRNQPVRQVPRLEF